MIKSSFTFSKRHKWYNCIGNCIAFILCWYISTFYMIHVLYFICYSPSVTDLTIDALGQEHCEMVYEKYVNTGKFKVKHIQTNKHKAYVMSHISTIIEHLYCWCTTKRSRCMGRTSLGWQNWVSLYGSTISRKRSSRTFNPFAYSKGIE